jgi:hypothetical protein
VNVRSDSECADVRWYSHAWSVVLGKSMTTVRVKWFFNHNVYCLSTGALSIWTD